MEKTYNGNDGLFSATRYGSERSRHYALHFKQHTIGKIIVCGRDEGIYLQINDATEFTADNYNSVNHIIQQIVKDAKATGFY